MPRTKLFIAYITFSTIWHLCHFQRNIGAGWSLQVNGDEVERLWMGLFVQNVLKGVCFHQQCFKIFFYQNMTVPANRELAQPSVQKGRIMARELAGEKHKRAVAAIVAERTAGLRKLRLMGLEGPSGKPPLTALRSITPSLPLSLSPSHSCPLQGLPPPPHPCPEGRGQQGQGQQGQGRLPGPLLPLSPLFPSRPPTHPRPALGPRPAKSGPRPSPALHLRCRATAGSGTRTAHSPPMMMWAR
jgi:hypothetical protein